MNVLLTAQSFTLSVALLNPRRRERNPKFKNLILVEHVPGEAHVLQLALYDRYSVCVAIIPVSGVTHTRHCRSPEVGKGAFVGCSWVSLDDVAALPARHKHQVPPPTHRHPLSPCIPPHSRGRVSMKPLTST